ncbi:methyl-accepting chemotaxis protein [Paenibacillus tarimensis]|uniref:methyl-accepting chemotaxis protein n=1 Tax=Paenibacillus tarimensis TaxID=416012 RepID=UPI001F28834F|nr:methyl-accepting chemotaxis protein [Paenibacillus tarimensis]MCF2944032.1 methyl-accepting chemotaxis protein [Paenibacillus tarimensis]
MKFKGFKKQDKTGLTDSQGKQSKPERPQKGKTGSQNGGSRLASLLPSPAKRQFLMDKLKTQSIVLGKRTRKLSAWMWEQTKALLSAGVSKSVGTKLFLIIFSGILICVLTVGLFSYSRSKAIIENKVAGMSEETIIQTAGKLDLMFQNYESMSMQLVVDTEFQNAARDLLAEDEDDFTRFSLIQELDTKFQGFLNSNGKMLFGSALIPLTDGLSIMNGGGTQLTDVGVMQTDWYEKALEANGKTYWIPTQPNGLSGNNSTPSIGLARVIKSMASSAPLYLLVMEIDYDIIEAQVADISLGEDSMLNIIDDSGNVVLGPNGEALAQPFDMDLSSYAEESGALRTERGDGKTVLAVYDTFSTMPWRVVGSIPVDSLVEDAKQIRNLTWIIAAAAVLIAIGIGFLVIRMIAVPLSQLRNLMNEGEKGNLAVRSDIRKEDEIGQLAQSFNKMMEQITLLVDQTNSSAKEVLSTAGDLTDASRKTAVAAKEIAVATEEIANGASSLAVEAERGSDITDSMASRMRKVTDANTEMGAAAAEVERASEKGTQYMGELIQKTGTTEEMTRSMVEKVDKLKDSTSSIRKILDVLNNLTKQTNILSLNATIEAARAGAAGRGFMVVADEIRKLADQSRQSIDVVGQITETIQTEIEDTVSVLSEAYPLFQEQIQSVKEANEIFLSVQNQMGGFAGQLQAVTASITELNETQSVLTEAMGNVSAVAEQSSATSEEVASLSNEQLGISERLVELSNKLEEVSNKLQSSLSRFQTGG